VKRQVLIRNTTAQAIMRRPEFGWGVDSVRNGEAPDFDSSQDRYWSYERGRLWACLAPHSMPLTINGKVNPKAIALFHAAERRGFII
jgi:hypothetical protein